VRLTLLRTFGPSDPYVVQSSVAPGRSTGWHSHPGPSPIIVVSGSFTNDNPSENNCAGQTFAAGSARSSTPAAQTSTGPRQRHDTRGTIRSRTA